MKSTAFNFLCQLFDNDSATDCVTSQSSERVHFYCNHEETDAKMFAYLKFLCDNICYDNYGGVSNHKFSYGNNYSQLKCPIIFYAF